MDCLYMQSRLHPVCVRRRRKNQGKSALYTEEMRYLRRFVQLMQPEFKHAGLPLPTELTATPYSGCQSLRGSPWCRSTPKIAADLRQLIAGPPEQSLCRQAHACDRQLKENNRYAVSNRFEQQCLTS